MLTVGFGRFIFLLGLSLTACWYAVRGMRISLQWMGFQAILSERASGNVGCMHRKSIEDNVMILFRRFYSSGGKLCVKRKRTKP